MLIKTLFYINFYFHYTDRSCSALDKCCAILEEGLLKEPLVLTFSGLAHFSHQVCMFL